jgi:hypothetical protein
MMAKETMSQVLAKAMAQPLTPERLKHMTNEIVQAASNQPLTDVPRIAATLNHIGHAMIIAGEQLLNTPIGKLGSKAVVVNKLGSKAVVVKPKAKLSPVRSKALRVQGRYLGLLRRHKSASTRAHIKKIAREKGLPAAIKELEKLRK